VTQVVVLDVLVDVVVDVEVLDVEETGVVQ